MTDFFIILAAMGVSYIVGKSCGWHACRARMARDAELRLLLCGEKQTQSKAEGDRAAVAAEWSA